jgi:hypothetical protein
VFNPIEAIGLTFLVATSRLRVPGLMRSDHDKHAEVVKLILGKAAPALEGDRTITNQELGDVLSPGWKRDLLRNLGAGIINGLYALGSGAIGLPRQALGWADHSLAALTPYEAVRNHGHDANV